MELCQCAKSFSPASHQEMSLTNAVSIVDSTLFAQQLAHIVFASFPAHVGSPCIAQMAVVRPYDHLIIL